MESLKCPKCDSEDLLEITGYCPTYGEPIINGQCMTGPDREMCCGYTETIQNAWYCNSCETVFDENVKMNLDDTYGFSTSPIGKVIDNEEIYSYEEIKKSYELRMEWSKKMYRE